MIHVYVEGQWHVEEQTPEGVIQTVCELSPGFHADWTHTEPTDDLCPTCFPDQEKPKPKAKKAK